MAAYLKASSNEKMYPDYLWVVGEAEKVEVMEPYCTHTADSTSKPTLMSFFPLQKAARHPAYQDPCCIGSTLTKKKVLRVKTPMALKA